MSKILLHLMLPEPLDFKKQLTNWIADHKSTTIPAWLKRNPAVLQWMEKETAQYTVKNVMERAYIVLNGPQPLCNEGNARQFNTFELGYRAGCVFGNSCKCVAALRKAGQLSTIRERYGVETTGKIPGVAEKRKQTMVDRYGAEYAMQSVQLKQRYNESASTRTETDKLETIKRAQQTSLEKYGVSHHMKLASQQEKLAATNCERYGAKVPMQNAEIASKTKQAWESKSQKELDQITKDRRSTFQEKYAVNSASQLAVPETTLQILQDKQLFDNFIQGKTRARVVNDLYIAAHTLYLYAKKYESSHLFAHANITSSQFEKEVAAFISSLNVDIECNDRTKIAPKELDIVIPEHNIAIECCGLYWHSETSSGKHKNYHYNKFKKCQELGIQLITIYEDEWKFKKSHVENKLRHLLKQSTTASYARKCKLTERTNSEVREFVNNHHMQGHIDAAINLTLEIDGKIMALMSFSKSRFNKNFQYEIARFCADGSVVGAASKLFSFFARKYSPESVISYNDNRWGNGNLYRSLGFTLGEVTVGYNYTNYLHRFDRTKFQKHKLVANGADTSLSEWEIMQNMGYDRIWDCGQSAWVWRRPRLPLDN